MPGPPLLQAGRGLGSLTETMCVCAGDVLTGGQEFDGSHLFQAAEGARQFHLREIYRFLSFLPAERLVSLLDGLAALADLFGIHPSATVETSMDAEVFRTREQNGVGPFPGTRPPAAAHVFPTG
jgi:hypothetical protein